MEMIEVSIPLTNKNVAAWPMWESENCGQPWLTTEVVDWIEERRRAGKQIEVRRKQEAVMGPNGGHLRVKGLNFIFDDHATAMLFKLTWGGQ